MSEATSSKTTTKKAASKKAAKSTTKRTTAKSRATTARKSASTSRSTTARKAAPKKAAPEKAAESPKKAGTATAKKSTTKKRASTVAKTATAKKTTAKATTSAKTASTKAGKTKSATSRKTTPKTAASSSSTQRKKSEKKSVKSAAKVPAAKAKPETAAENNVAEDDKPKIAPAPMRPALRVAKRAEARRDKNQTFKVNTQIIYPAHGVGHIAAVEKQSIADIEVELFVIDFEHEKMKLRVPVAKAAASGMRNLSTSDQIDGALEMLEGKARVKRTMWSRRAQEYEAKINSGDLISVAEVVRDLFRAEDQPEQSYSERQLFEQARERFGREVAAVRKKTLEKAIEEIHVHLDRKEKAEAK